MLWYLLLFHGLAKLRMHSETTRQATERVSRDMCRTVREFVKKTRNIKTRELPSIVDRNNRRQAAKKKKTGTESTDKGTKKKVKNTLKKKTKDGETVVVLNLVKFKFHHHCNTSEDILQFGPTDVYSTQSVRILLPFQCICNESDST